MFLPPLFTLPLSCLIDFMPVHEKDPAFHLLCLYSQRNTKFSRALTLLTEIIPKFSSPLLLQEMLKSHFQLNLTWSTTGENGKVLSLWLNYEHTALRVQKKKKSSQFELLRFRDNSPYAISKHEYGNHIQFTTRKWSSCGLMCACFGAVIGASVVHKKRLLKVPSFNSIFFS